MAIAHRAVRGFVACLFPALRACAPLLLLLATAGNAHAQSRADAIECEATVQGVYWDLRNEGKAGSFPRARYAAALGRRADRTARQLAYVREFRGHDIDAAALQDEIDRLQRDTRAPKALARLFAALDNDPRRIGECLAKPLLAERWARDAFASDPDMQADVRSRARRDIDRLLDGGKPASASVASTRATSGRARGWLRDFGREDWSAPRPGAARARPMVSSLLASEGRLRALVGRPRDGVLELHLLTWKTLPFDAWWDAAGSGFAADYDARATAALQLRAVPALARIGEWQPMRRFDTYLQARAGGNTNATVVSTGVEIIVWGGSVLPADFEKTDPEDYALGLDSGVAYNPATDTWRTLPTSGAPAAREKALGLWTGSEMLVQGGYARPTTGSTSYVPYHDGGLYDPVDDTWRPVVDAPAQWPANESATVVWTGSRAIFYGGQFRGAQGIVIGNPIAAGAIFDPATGTWTAFAPTAAQIGFAEPKRTAHSAVWTGTTMLVFGGAIVFDVCGNGTDSFAFNPFTSVGEKLPNRPGNASASFYAPAFWNGSVAILYSGARFETCSQAYQSLALRYDPAAHAWSAMNPSGDPGASAGSFTPVLMGNRLVVWGGYDAGNLPRATGGIYRVDTNTWVPINPTGAPLKRIGYTAAGVGAEMVVFGGDCYDENAAAYFACPSGKRFNPATNAWRDLVLPAYSGPPSYRENAAAAGSATELFVWGGTGPSGGGVADGAVYDRITDHWRSTNTVGAPTARDSAYAAFGGSQFLVWGGHDVALGTEFGDGKRYDPVAGTWSPIPAPPLTLARTGEVVSWDGTGLFVWGGVDSDSRNTGARYVPGTGWTLLSTTNAPSARAGANFASDGAGRTLVFRGGGATDSAVFNAAGNTWTPVPDNGSFPAGDVNPMFAITGWLGDRFGLLSLDSATNVLRRLDNPATGAWSVASSVGAPTNAAPTGGGGSNATTRAAAWTGKQWLVWGNYSVEPHDQPLGWLFRSASNTWSTPPVAGEPRSDWGAYVVRVGDATAVWGGTHHVSGSLYLEDTRTGPLAANLGVSLSRTPAEPALGDVITFHVDATNHGPDAATGVTATLDLQQNLAFTAIEDGGATCMTPAVNATGPTTCTLGTLLAGETRRFTVLAQAFSAAQATVQAGIAGSGVEADGNAANNSATQQFVVLAEPPPPLTISVTDASVVEGASGTTSLTFTARLSRTSSQAVTFAISTANGTATAGSDYAARSLAGQSIAAGQLAKAFVVTVNGDTTVEPNETVVANLGAVSGAAVADGQAVGTITNDDGPTLSIGDMSLNEGDSGTKLLTFTATLSQATAGPVTFNAATANDSAVAGQDYVAATFTGLVIPAGQLSKAFSVAVNGETLVEPLETFLVNLTTATGATISDAQAIGYIINNDGALITIDDVAVGEGNSGTKVMTFTVSLSQVAPGPVTYNITSQDSSATAGSDYVAINLTGQVIPQGQLSKTHTITINGDTTVEDTEVVFVNVRQPVGASVWDGQGIGYLLNDDGPTLSIPDASTSEGASGTKVMNVTVLLSQVTTVPVTFTLGSANVSATAGSDYVALDSSTVHTIPAGQTSKAFQVTVNGDTAVEQNESFTLTLGNATGATLYDRQAIATIYNDDGPTLSVNDVSISEGNSGTKVATFTVTLSQAAPVAVTYNIATSNLTATAGSDYVAKSLAGQSIPAGQLSKTFTVTINGDTSVEPNETFRVTLSNISANATLFKFTGTGTLANDD